MSRYQGLMLRCSCNERYMFVFISNTFRSNPRLKLTKNQAYANQHPEAELLTFEIYFNSSSTLSSNNNRTYRIYVIKMKIDPHRYDISRPRCRKGHNIINT